MLGDCLSLGVSESKNYLWSGSPYFSLKTVLSLSDKLIPGSVELISSEMATGVFSGFILKVVFGNVLLFCVAIFFLQKSFESIFWQCASNIRASYWFSLAATFFAMMNLSESEWLHMIEIILIAKMLHCTKRIVPTLIFMASYFHQRKVHSREILRIYVLLLGNNSSLVIDGVECSKSYFMDQMSFK